MLTKSMRGSLGMALAVVMTVSVFSEWAAAQQTGLFPLAPIRRQRVPCSQEDPVYRIYKEQYFGYHPTMWRRFPDGWGAPSPEAPNAAASYAAIPLQPPEEPDDGQGDTGEFDEGPGMGGQPGGAKPELPAPPGEQDRSPFELEPPNGAGAAPLNRNDAPTAPRPAEPNQGEPSPFEQLNPRAGAPRGGDAEPVAARASWNGRRYDRNVAEAARPLLSTDDSPVRVNGVGSGLVDMTDALDAHSVNPRSAAAANPEAARRPAPRRERVAAANDAPRWNAVRR